MRYLTVSSTLKMFHRFCLKQMDARSITTGRFSCIYLTVPDRSKQSVSVRRVKFFNDEIRHRIQNIAQNSKEILTTTSLGEMRNAPTNYFWLNMMGAAAFFAPPVLSMIGGYSPFLTGLELKYAALYLSFLGGMSWMHYASTEDVAWDRVGHSVLPPAIALTGLLLPTTLGYPITIFGMLLSLYRDIICSVYQTWGSALRLFVTTVAVVSMLLMLIGHILFG